MTDLGSKTAEWDEQVAESGPTDNAGPTSYVERLLLLLLILLLLALLLRPPRLHSC